MCLPLDSSVRGEFLSMKRCVFLVIMATLVVGCGDGDGPTAPSVNVPFSVTELRAGTGREAVAGKGVTVQYAGWLYDPNQPNNKGSLFDTSVNRGPYSFVLGVGAVIRGWDQGLVGLKVGGVRQLVIPPDLAYGAAGNGPIPPNATLLFEVELLAVAD
jgi:FKBP-type peptidyl-prolyl cis-trans isomerase FkpA